MTPVRYLAPGSGKTKTGYFWTTSRSGGDAVYQWETSRGSPCLDNVLPVDFRGTVQCDASRVRQLRPPQKAHPTGGLLGAREKEIL
jgi:hypothetical protein